MPNRYERFMITADLTHGKLGAEKATRLLGWAAPGRVPPALGAPAALQVNGAVVVVSAALLLVRAPSYRWAARADVRTG